MRTPKEKVFKNPETRILSIEMHEGFRRIDERFGGMEQRFTSMEQRFDGQQREMNIRFEGMDQKFSIVYWILALGFTLILSLQGVVIKFVIH